jgi:hypothetical protein
MSKRGGKRAGAGRKPARGEAKVTTSIEVTPTLKEYLSQCEQSQSEVIESAIRKTKSFRQWLESRSG